MSQHMSKEEIEKYLKKNDKYRKLAVFLGWIIYLFLIVFNVTAFVVICKLIVEAWKWIL